MEATCWSDYLCPWCYVGQARSAQMEELGLTVVHRAFELHPEIGPEGRRVRPDGRLAPTFERVAAACEQAGLPWRAPSRMPNTRRALATAEWVLAHHPHAFDALHRSLFRAHFADGRALDDDDVLDELVEAAGAPVDELQAARSDGRADALVGASMAEARASGVSSTPTWVLDNGFAIPGALDPQTFERWISRLVERAARPDG